MLNTKGPLVCWDVLVAHILPYCFNNLHAGVTLRLVCKRARDYIDAYPAQFFSAWIKQRKRKISYELARVTNVHRDELAHWFEVVYQKCIPILKHQLLGLASPCVSLPHVMHVLKHGGLYQHQLIYVNSTPYIAVLYVDYYRVDTSKETSITLKNLTVLPGTCKPNRALAFDYCSIAYSAGASYARVYTRTFDSGRRYGQLQEIPIPFMHND